MQHDSNEEPRWRTLACSQCEGELQPAAPPGSWALTRFDNGALTTITGRATDTLPVLPLRCVDCGTVVLWAGAPDSADDLWRGKPTRGVGRA